MEVSEHLQQMSETPQGRLTTLAVVSPTAVVILKTWFFVSVVGKRSGVPDMTPGSELALDRLALALTGN